MAIACKICIMTKGIRGGDRNSFFETQEELNDHLEKVHHMPVQRDGETREERVKRFIEKYPEARICPECVAAGAEWTKQEEVMTEEAITYKEFYNKDRGLPEPIWGGRVDEPVIQCPWCGSTDMYYSGSPDDPEEMFGAEGSVRCKRCGHITDWFEALKQREHHPTDTPREVIGGPDEVPN